MSDKFEISEKKVLEHNEKARQDTLTLFSMMKDGDVQNVINTLEKEPFHKDLLSMCYLDKGRTIWLELKVEDSFLSGLIYSCMFSKSKHEGESGLHALGCSIKQIMYSKPSGYSEDEKQAIKKLYEAAFVI